MYKSYFKGYWLITNRCNFNCSYCVLENSTKHLKNELNFEKKKELISHLYDRLDFRSLTLSGGEALIIGNDPPKEFISLLQHIRQFRSNNPKDNLEIELYTNGVLLNESTIANMIGVVDTVALTIDSLQSSILFKIGRNNKKVENYYQSVLKKVSLLYENGIDVKLHSVVSQKNYYVLHKEVNQILLDLKDMNSKVQSWKFYQYMSYDNPRKDSLHAITNDIFQSFQERVKQLLKNQDLRLKFKNNLEMNESIANILAYGNLQYMRNGDSWSTSRRTKSLLNYNSMQELFEQHEIDETLFRKYHEIVFK